MFVFVLPRKVFALESRLILDHSSLGLFFFLQNSELVSTHSFVFLGSEVVYAYGMIEFKNNLLEQIEQIELNSSGRESLPRN